MSGLGNKKKTCRAENSRWLAGSIRRKLALFVGITLIVVIGLFWLFTVQLLGPAYERSINANLDKALQTVAVILNVADAQGDLLVVDVAAGTMALSETANNAMNQAIADGSLDTSNRCLEVANSDGVYIGGAEGLGTRCLLHPSRETFVYYGYGVASMRDPERDRDSPMAVAIRRLVRQYGHYETVQQGQIIRGITAAGGKLTVILSTNQERIPQAVNVLRSLFLPLSVLLFAVSSLMAWIFSSWFTRPISRLSAAAREMGRGNYDVQVEACGDDEIGELGRDFNQMAREVKRSAELQRDLLANVSHDLRTPLTLIKGYAETVRDLTGDEREKRTEQLNVIVDEADRLSSLVGSVLELTRVTSGSEKIEKVRFDLTQLCEEVAYRYEAAGAQTGLRFVYTGEAACEIYADPAMVERALHNLLGNALKHVGDDKYVGLSVYRTAGGMARVEVSDHGKGVAREDQAHIFERYYRARADAGKPGTGLGLSITKAIFEANGFPFGVQSAPGEGATFWFEAKLV